MDESLLFKSLSRNDENKILDLFKFSFNRDIDREVWRWLSYDCPTGLNRTSIIQDINTHELVGSYSLLPIRLRLNNREVKASLCNNVNTHPNYQGRGLFTKLGFYALGLENGFNTTVSLGMPNQKAIPGHLKVNWKVMCNLPFLVKHNCKVQSHDCIEVKKFDKEFDDFFRRTAKKFAFIVLKDHQFMNWRVVSRPDQKYKIYIYRDNNQLKGYVVLKHFKEGEYSKTHIIDIHADSHEILHHLISVAESFAYNSDELNMWTNYHNPYQQVFLNRGFYERSSTDLLIIHFNDDKQSEIQDGNWWFCLADNDVY